jgi:hypothetical protein
MLVFLPIVLRRFSTAEVALWQVFSSVFGLQVLAETGFGQSFIRAVAYGLSGAATLSSASERSTPSTKVSSPNVQLLNRTVASMKYIYLITSCLLLLLILLLGIPAISSRIGQITTPNINYKIGAFSLPIPGLWIAAVLVGVSTVAAFHAGLYSVICQGFQHIILLRRWECGIAIIGLLVNLCTLKMGASLAQFVIFSQVSTLATVFVTRWLGKRLCKIHLGTVPKSKLDREIFHHIWPRAWRSGLGVFFNYIVTSGSGLIYARSKDSDSVLSYLLAVRLIQTISQASQAPFYSKVPSFAFLWAKGEEQSLLKSANRGMVVSLAAFIVPWLLLSSFGSQIFKAFSSNTSFPESGIWLVLGAAILCERYGAMHIQLYSVSDKIVWHWVNGSTGIVYILLAVGLYGRYHVIGLCWSALLANLCIYALVSSALSRKQFGSNLRRFDSMILRPIVAIGLLVTVTSVVTSR